RTYACHPIVRISTVSIFFFYAPGAHRNLHSFPTRRSSDLDDAPDMADLRSFTRDLVTQMEKDLDTRLDWVAVDHWNTEHPHVHRSEEHTSELQSQSNLVCRLLLEKKKTNCFSRTKLPSIPK